MITLDCQKATISLSGANCIITAPYNAELVAEIKNIPGRKWNQDKKCWMVPASAEEDAREIVRKFFAIQGEESHIEYEVLDMTVIGDNTHKKSYPHNVEIDGCEIMNLNYGNIISVSPTFQVISGEGGFTDGDARHAFTVQFRIQVKCRKGAKVDGTGRCGKGQFEIHSRQKWTEAHGLTSFEERKMQAKKTEEQMKNEDSASESESQVEDDGSSTSLKYKVLTFGKYQGQSLASVPASYLKWLMQHVQVMKAENRKFALFAKEILTSDAK